MERKHKIIIISLVIVIVALAAGLSYMLLGNGFSGEESVPDGMQRYDFDSRFTMVVPDDARFLKDWEASILGLDQSIIYFDKHNKFAVAYANSPMVTKELIDYAVEYGNASGNATIELDGNLIISHNLKNSGKIGKTYDDSEFKYGIMLQNGHEIVLVAGNDLNSVKAMANSIKFYEGGD